MYNNSKNTIIAPLIFFTALAMGVFIGAYFFGELGNSKNNSSVKKLNEILQYVENEYVDKVDADTLVEQSIEDILSRLDPHTSYIPKQDLSIVHSQLEGGFEGIGVEFQIIEDTIYVVSAIPGGPSESQGIQSGDKIIKVNGKQVAGNGITSEGVFKLLRGKKGTEVKIKIYRSSNRKLLNFNIIRDKIPTHSVETSFMINDKIGFIKVNRFAETTYDEFHDALSNLKDKGMKQLILDLRDNPGGYLEVAVKMVDELLAGEKLVVYTNGKAHNYNSSYSTNKDGLFEKGPIIVLINEGSASASEILSGALQDHDRALIVGRRSFGKGLVQRPIALSDGSELRLTISKYYTPSGRCIQKPMGKDYDQDLINRFNHGELYNKDSIKLNTKEEFKTSKGRKVYGGGGIMPDVFIPRDTTEITHLLGEIYSKNILREIALNYVAINKLALEKQKLEGFSKSFDIEKNLFPELKIALKRNNINYTEKELSRSKFLIINNLKAYIAKGIWGEKAFWPIFLQQDKLYLKAQTLFPEAEKMK